MKEFIKSYNTLNSQYPEIVEKSIRALVFQAEMKSSNTCEVCGKLHTPEQFGQPADLHPDTLPELIRTASRFIFGQF